MLTGDRAILRVSKKWEQFLSSLRNLWMRIDLSNARGKVHWTALSAYIRRSKAMLTDAVVKNLNPRFAQKSLQLLSRCPHLEYLDVSASVSGKEFYDLFKGSKRLRTLIAADGVAIPQAYLSKFLADLPHLERCEVYDARNSLMPHVQWPDECPHLKRLCLRSQKSNPTSLANRGPPFAVPCSNRVQYPAMSFEWKLTCCRTRILSLISKS